MLASLQLRRIFFLRRVLFCLPVQLPPFLKSVLDEFLVTPGSWLIKGFAAEMVGKITSSGSEFETLTRLGQASGPEGLEHLSQVAGTNEAARGELNRLLSLFEQLRLLGVGEYCSFDMGVVRGLAYYTGVVFEGFGRGGLQRAICGGGRYGHLLEVVGGPPMSGIGFGTSDVVILDLLTELGRLPERASVAKRLDVFVIDAEERFLPAALALTAKLRQGGYAAEFSYRRQAIGKQLKQASAARAARAVIIGAEFAERGVLTVKDLATGAQAQVPQAEFVAQPLAEVVAGVP